ncbi:unnamed protein product [Alternaria burnsii]|nr:unnamed protein product [Alternaria burnsii]
MIPLFVLWGAIVLLQAYATVGQKERYFLTVAPHRALLFTTSASGHSFNYRYQGPNGSIFTEGCLERNRHNLSQSWPREHKASARERTTEGNSCVSAKTASSSVSMPT